MKEITLMRHFRPDIKDYNELSYEKFISYCDGILDPHIISKSYRDFDTCGIRPDIIYSSTAQRCIDTANIVYSIIKKRPITIMRKQRLREASLLNLEITEKEWNDLESWEQKRKLIITKCFRSPEYFECSSRLDYFIEQLKQSTKKRILIVSHAFTLWLMQKKIEEIMIDNFEITRYKPLKFGEMETLEWRY